MPPAGDKRVKGFHLKKVEIMNTLQDFEEFVKSYDCEIDALQIPSRSEQLEELSREFNKLRKEFNETVDDLEAFEAMQKDRREFNKRYHELRAFLIKASPRFGSSSIFNSTQANTTISAGTQPHLRLPKVDLPSFDGEITKWLTFKDRFASMVHDSAEMPEVLKLQYLLSALKGDVARQFEHMQITTDNYSVTWEALLKRFDNKKVLKREYFKAFYSLEKMNTDSTEELSRIVNEACRLVRGLERLNEPVNTWDTPLTSLLFYKLTKKTLMAWEQHSCEHITDEYKCLIAFLEQRVNILKSSAQNMFDSTQVNSIMVTGKQGKRDNRNIALPVHQANNIKNGVAKCPLCNEPHHLQACDQFVRMSLVNREEIVRKYGLCFNCLRKGHSARDCRSSFVCQKCNRKHHTKLCKTIKPAESEAVPSTSRVAATAQRVNRSKMVILSTAQVIILKANNQPYKVRALLDNGSQLNFITESLAQELRLKRVRCNEQIAGVGGVVMKVAGSVVGTIKSLVTEYSSCLEFLVLPKITADLPSQTFDASDWNIPKGIRLADPSFFERNPIDMLIGAETFVELIKAKTLKLDRGLPTLLESELGWIVSGAYNRINGKQSMACTVLNQDDQSDIKDLMHAFFNIEEVQDQRLWSVEEEECEEQFRTTTTRGTNGRYNVRLPFKSERGLGESVEIATRRLKGLERRFEREPQMKQEYAAFMDEYISLGHMSVKDNVNTNEGYYMPHHAVYKKDSSTTKCRVVFDASCKTSNGRSLNDILKVGPTVQEDATHILLRWRRKTVAVVGDVEKMYRQVLVHEDDRKFQRVLWRSNPNEPIKTYELNTVTYGTASAPFLAIRTLNQVLEDHKDNYPLAASRVNDFYVDDFISGADTENEAKQLCQEAKAVLAKGGFPLRKWGSNRPHVLPNESDNGKQIIALNSKEGSLSTLGLVWNPLADTLGIKIADLETGQPCTKRTIIRTIAKIYDPLGIVDTVKAKAKQFMQRVWTLKGVHGDTSDWDDEIPQQMRQEWERFERQLVLLQEIQVPRNVSIEGAKDIQIHGFSDASEGGYGACVYVRSSSEAEVVSRLYVSKSKVTPLATKHSIARLELCAAHLLSRLLTKIRKATGESFPTFCWTDSSTVLHWLNSSPSRWKTFVANRVSQIQTGTKECEWRHVPGIQNPADAVSRGRNPSEVSGDKLWWHGPDWLIKNEQYWPNIMESGSMHEAVKEEKRITSVLTCVVKEPSFINELCERVSSFTKLKRIVVYCVRFVEKLKGINHRIPFLDVSELKRAENIIIRLVQGEVFAKEIQSLKRGQCVMKGSPLRFINPVWDKDDVLRVGGRLSNADITDEQKHPVIIPGKHRLAELIADKYHRILRHAGSQLTLNTIQQRYWILGARNVVKRTVYSCVRCTRCRPSLIQQPMADLPQQRVRQSRPFSITGVDYAGPILTKGAHRRAVPTKSYIAIFICFVTKAVHIELVSNLTSSAFLASLRRFIARRGKVAELHSDNGTNFRGANNNLRELYKLLKSEAHQEAVTGWCAEQEIKWKFTPPAAPHFGGLWEAAVKSMKFHLKRVVGTGQLTYEDLSTLLAEIEACLNSRPITAITEDPHDMEALTPGHFLVGNNLQTVPNVDISDIPANRLNHWRLVQRHMQHIWQRWHREYLQTLQKRAKWNNSPCAIIPGRLVVLQEDNLAVCKWPLARITKLHPGKDGVTRVVSLKCTNGKEIRRPVQKIAPLPIE